MSETPDRDDDTVLAGEYALGLLSAEEAAVFEARLGAEPELRALYAAWAEDFAQLAEDIPAETPPAQVKTLIEKNGGKASTYTCDLADVEAADKLCTRVIKDHGAVDVLVNNAGRSIRRSINLSYDRFHDFERCMSLNYFGALKMILGLLPEMEKRRSGHIINISSIGVLTNAPRFSAYVASKAALDAFSRCAASEFNDTGVAFTTINMPLVRTPMIAPTKMYDSVPTITPEDAADMVKQAVIYRPQRIATRLGIFGQVLHGVAPKISEIVMNSAYRMFPDSAAARGERPGKDERSVTQEQMAFAHLMRGIHW